MEINDSQRCITKIHISILSEFYDKDELIIVINELDHEYKLRLLKLGENDDPYTKYECQCSVTYSGLHIRGKYQ